MKDKTYKNSLAKYVHEYMYWKKCVTEHGPLRNDHYEKQFTTMFGLEKAFYTGKKVLDVGCGPCGSLEWADNTLQRVGVDPRRGLRIFAPVAPCHGVCARLHRVHEL